MKLIKRPASNTVDIYSVGSEKLKFNEVVFLLKKDGYTPRFKYENFELSEANRDNYSSVIARFSDIQDMDVFEAKYKFAKENSTQKEINIPSADKDNYVKDFINKKKSTTKTKQAEIEK